MMSALSSVSMTPWKSGTTVGSVRRRGWLAPLEAPGDPSLGPALRQEDVPVLRAVRPGECHARLVEIGESNAIERLQVPDATPLFSRQLSREGCGPDEVTFCA